MAATDPRYIIKDILDTYIAANPITKDDDVTNATVLHIYERGPEALKYLFFTRDFDVIITYGEPRVRSSREIQNVPTHYAMSYPVTVTTTDKYELAVLVCTATTMQAKARTAVRNGVEASAQSSLPSYTLVVDEENGRSSRQGGLLLWETPYILQYKIGQ